MKSIIEISNPQKRNAKINIYADKLRFPVSPTLYGLFFEEISHAGDGGLYAELIRNRSFEDSLIPKRCHVENAKLHSPTGWVAPFEESDSIPGWRLIQQEGSYGKIALDRDQPLSYAHPISLRVESNFSGGGRIVLANEGYWGISIRNGAKYILSFYARKSQSFRGNLDLTLESKVGQVYATGKVVIDSKQWNKYELTLESIVEDAEAVFVISTKDSGTFWLELVSLFPQNTWKKKRNGMRPDLVHMLEGLNPRFLRFPGGCFVEGFSVETASRWKKTIGELTERTSHFTLWNYRTTNGLGYHEYLQFAEDMCMEMMFVVNCGMTCQGRMGDLIPLEQLDEWVQDMLDAVEYANGTITSKWGAIRARNGHPEPFGLKYIEIGNENFGPDYNLRYKVFFNALKAKYPEIITIFNTHWEVGTETDGLPVEIADEHFYPDPEYFQLYHNMYDSYDRKGPKIYVGEYAQTVGNEEGTLAGAMCEAAFMTGMERNQDIVVMSSYAPLFANVKHTVWNPNLIYFNGVSVYGTPSYYVQKLFGENQGDMVVEAKVETDTRKPFIQGGVTISLQDLSKVKDIEITQNGTPLFKEKQITGKEANIIREGDNIQIGDGSLKEYNMNFKFKPEDKELRIKLLDNHKLYDKQNYFQWELSKDNSKLVHISGWSRVKAIPSQKLELNSEWQDARVEVRSESICCYLNGSLIHVHQIGKIPYLTSVTTLDLKRNELIVKMVNASDCEISTVVNIQGVEVLPEGEEIVLTSENPRDNNSMENPMKVAPKTEVFKVSGNSFPYYVKPYSLVILKLRLRMV